MAHEIPLQVHHKAPTGTKTRKHKPLHHPKHLLPNGEKPNFGQGQREKPGKGRSPQLPNGEKPDFGSSDHKKDNGGKDHSGKKSKRGSGKKPMGINPAGGSPVILNNGEGKECYAGSSFHSSPEALALPKPSFARNSFGNPKTMSQSQSQYTGHNDSVNVVNMSPGLVYQGMPPNGPPRHPVTTYPPSSPPGFNYHANRQGFINYLYPPAAVPQPPLPLQSYPFQAYPLMPPQPLPSQQYGGQKISFSELMGSTRWYHSSLYDFGWFPIH